MSVVKRMKSLSLVGLLAAALGGCGLAQESNSFWQNGFWNEQPSASAVATSTDLGLAELAKGNYSLAEAHLADALRKDPNDQYANLAAGLLYQNTGRPKEAAAFYQHLSRLNPAQGAMFAVPGRANLQPIGDIASTNLALLTGPDINTFGAPGTVDGAFASPTTPVQTNPMTSLNPMSAAVNAPASQLEPNLQMALGEGGAQVSDAAFQNIVTRFEAVNRLLNVGLITEDEFRERRGANIGALLPLTKPAAATGLDRPVPPPSQIAGRLQALSKSLQMRAISPQEHAAERSVILDALMPANPNVRTGPAAPPTGLLEAADAVRRLGKLQAAGLITSDEYSAERAAIERELQAGGGAPGTVAEPMSGPADGAPAGGPRRVMAPGGQAPEKPAMAASGPQPGVHLASYRSRGAAMEGWKTLQRKYGSILGSLDAELSEVNLGASKGTFFRLIAGPVSSTGDARRICSGLKSTRQFCEPAIYPQG